MINSCATSDPTIKTNESISKFNQFTNENGILYYITTPQGNYLSLSNMSWRAVNITGLITNKQGNCNKSVDFVILVVA